jgi:hypothetical protein
MKQSYDPNIAQPTGAAQDNAQCAGDMPPQLKATRDSLPTWEDEPLNFGQKRLHEVHKLELQIEANEALARAKEAEERAAEKMVEKEKIRAGIMTATDEDAPWHGRHLIGRSMAEVRLRAIDWLWTGWIPRKYITLIVGESGAGKSTVLADIVARITTGTPWPGETEWRVPARVLWLGSEDGAEDMTAPRLEACHADRSRVIEIQGTAQGKNRKRTTFSMQDDIDLVTEWLEWAQKQNDPFVMLVIDPITSYLPGKRLRKVDMNDTGQMRSILEPWFSVAQKYNLAIGSVTHFNKDTTRSMLHRVTGSAVFAQTCRSLCAMVEREDDGTFEKAMVQVKVNLPDHPRGAWRFRTEKVTVGIDPENGRSIHATRPAWDGLDRELTPQSLMGGERGPLAKNDYDVTFPMWLKAYFMSADPAQGLPITTVMDAAINGKVVSRKWWRENSNKYLDKANVRGTWMCRPTTAIQN